MLYPQRGLLWFSSVAQVQLFVTPRTAACQASLSITNPWSLLKLMSIESVMPSNHAILCHPFWLHSINFSSLQPAVIITLPCSVVFLCCCSVTKLYPPLCDPMNCSMPGFSVHHYLPECSNLCPLSQWYHPTNHLILCCPLLLPSISPSIGSFPMSQFFASSSQSIRASASASVLSMNIQDWFL